MFRGNGIVAVIIAAAWLPVAAQAGSGSSVAQPGRIPPPLPSGEHTVVGVFTQSGNPAQTLNSGYNTIEAATITCPRYNTCTLIMNVMAQIGNASSTGEWAINVLVDGISVDGGPIQASMPAANKYQIHNWQGEYPVRYGKHTIEYQIYVPTSAVAYQYSVSYMITVP